MEPFHSGKFKVEVTNKNQQCVIMITFIIMHLLMQIKLKVQCAPFSGIVPPPLPRMQKNTAATENTKNVKGPL